MRTQIAIARAESPIVFSLGTCVAFLLFDPVLMASLGRLYLFTLSLVLPDFTQTTPGPTLSVPQELFVVAATVGLYSVFLIMQTGRHHGYFAGQEAATARPRPAGKNTPLLLHAVMLVAYLVPVVF